MADFKFAKDKLAEVVGALKDYQVFAPAAVGYVMRFKPVEDPAAVSLDYMNTNVPPKELMFPETETLFKFRVGGTAIEPEVPDKAAKRLVFGIRPCDAMAYTIVEKLYSWDYPDPYFADRRESSVLFGMACSEPQANCFCPSMGGGPASEKGLDAIMFDLGDTVYVKTLTEAGDAAAKAMGLEAAGGGEAKAAAAKEKDALGKIKRSLDT